MHEEFYRSRAQLNWAFLIPPQCGVAACAEGDPGIGKTKTLEALADQAGRSFYSYELSRTQPEDLQGFPIVESDTDRNGHPHKFMRFVPDERLWRAEQESSVLLLDEVTNVIAPKQAPALNLIQNPPANSWMFMACNPLSSAADGQPLACPFINRIWYGEWEIDIEAQDYGLKNGLEYPPPDIPLVPADYMRHHPYWGRVVTMYLQYFPQERNACPDGREEKHKPWASSRQWHNLTKVLAAASAVGADFDTQYKLISGLLGSTAGPQFHEWLQTLDWDSPESILRDPSLILNYTRYDILFALLTAVVNFVANQYTQHQVSYLEQAKALSRTVEDYNPELSSTLNAALREIFPEWYRVQDNDDLLTARNGG